MNICAKGEIGNVAPATGGWNVSGKISTKVFLYKGANTIAVSGPVVDNSNSQGNFFTIYNENFSNSSTANLDCIQLTKEAESETTQESTVPQTTMPDTTATPTTTPESTIPYTTLPETTIAHTTIPETTIAQTTISETTDKESKTQKITSAISSDKRKITYNIKNKKVKIKSAKYRNKKILLKYKRVKGAKGYQIRYSTSKRFKKSKTINTKKLKYTIRKIRKKKYYIKVRAFALHKGKKVFGQWSRRKIVKAKSSGWKMIKK